MSKYTRRTVTSWIAGGTIAAAAMCAFVPSVSAQENWDEVVAAAKKEGKVVFYNNLQPNGIEPLLQKFREEYPEIQTEMIRLGSNPLIERFATEFNANRHLADVLITFPDERIYEGVKAGWAAQWSPPEAKNFAPELIEDNTLFTLQQAREALIWNKNLVPAGEEPKEWTDLFDPKWKGKVGMNPPWRSISIQQIVAYWEDKLNLGDTAQKLKDNDVRFFEGSGGIIQAVIRGDVQLAELTDLPLNPLLEDGAPVGFVYPESGTTLSSNKAFVAAKAPHPNAAKVFVNWLMTAKGQEYLQQYAGLSATRNDAPPLTQLPATKDLKNAVDGETVLNPERQAKMVDHWRTTFGVK
ncbi:iron ABC transporter substrate-binding protein [Agaricicola taiwanensis]|uniref:Iron ABC transporter substrate-binding protein n=1 Tax=Agaricicola taiwanensis TaxID=591372 RepID=A0A8J2VDM0_9RHOB|nr:extracellular solute-binding protein [Agaricicola taiwanensis]GGE27648.1 iron ABC transporter substrate-binding protein [Agaricicola taiwanensis]